ncbi:MAG: hypothetical protein AAF546_15280 [Verrucomicrobiota bacterium]
MNQFDDLPDWTQQFDGFLEGPLSFVIVAAVYLTIFFSAYSVSLKGVFDQFPSFKKLITYGFIEQFVVFAVIGTLLFITYQIAGITGQLLSTQQNAAAGIVIAVFLALGIGSIFLKQWIVSNMIDIEITFMQTITIAVMHLFYSYLIPVLVAVAVSLALKPFAG